MVCGISPPYNISSTLFATINKNSEKKWFLVSAPYNISSTLFATINRNSGKNDLR